MTGRLDVKIDSDNSYTDNIKLEVTVNRTSDLAWIKLGDREVAVDANELYHIVSFGVNGDPDAS